MMSAGGDGCGILPAMRRLLSVALASGCGFHVAAGGDAGRDGSSTIDASGDGASAIDAAIDASAIDAAIDAPSIDAFVFTPALCPVAYDRTTAAAPGSRFRVITTQAVFSSQHADCKDDAPGWTHLVVFDAQAEASAVGAMISAFFYVGIVQAPSQAGVGQGWFKLTGGAHATSWSSQSPQQPEDGDEYVENNEENLAVAGTNGALYDVIGSTGYRAVCECDGLPIDPTVAALIP